MAGAAAKRRRRCTNGIAALPEDVILQVFSRVGNVKDLFKFAMTCRRWLRRFTDPAFLRRLCPGQGEGHSARLLGFFFQQTRFVQPHGTMKKMKKMMKKMMKMRMTQHTSVADAAPSFLPTPGSPLGPTDRALTSFVADSDGTFNYAEPLASRRGIILLQLVPRTFDLKRVTATCHLLGLCNPITGERHVLPPLERSDPARYDVVDSYAIITAADSNLDGKHPPSSSSGRFKFSQLLLITTQAESNLACLHSYSAAARSWSAPSMCLDGSRFSMVGERSAVVHQGAAHWLCIDRKHCSRREDYDLLYKLSAEVGTATARASLTKIPVRGGGSPLLCVGRDGKLAVACVHRLHVTVWTQQGGEDCGGDSTATWLRTTVTRITNYPHLCRPCGDECAWLDFNRGSMLALPRARSGGVFVLDLEKKVVEKVMDCWLPLFSNERNRFSDGRDGTCVSYEMDLVEFFVLQLGGLCRGLLQNDHACYAVEN